MLKSYRVGLGGGVVACEILVSAQGPLVLGFWVFGLRVWGQGLTKTISKKILRLFNVFVRSFYHIGNVL